MFSECRVIYQVLFTSFQLFELPPSAPREAGQHAHTNTYTPHIAWGRKCKLLIKEVFSTALYRIAAPSPLTCHSSYPLYPALCFSIRLPTAFCVYLFIVCLLSLRAGTLCLLFSAKSLSPKTVRTIQWGLSKWNESLPPIYKLGIKSQMFK